MSWKWDGAGWVETLFAKIFSRRLHTEIRCYLFSASPSMTTVPQRGTKSSSRPRFTCDNHQNGPKYDVNFGSSLNPGCLLGSICIMFISRKYVRIWEAALAFICVLVLFTMSLCLPRLDDWFSNNTALFYFWIGLPNSCIGTDVKDIGLWCLYPFQPLMF